MPDLSVISNLKNLCLNHLEPLRSLFGPIIITSGYRNIQLNTLVGGHPNSGHLYGLSCDFQIKKEDKIISPLYVVAMSKIKYISLTYGKLICYLDQKRFHIDSGHQKMIFLKFDLMDNYIDITNEFSG